MGASKKAADSDTEARVHIAGPLKLQNELMASLVERETGLPCSHSQKLNLKAIVSEKNHPKVLVLYDCSHSDPDHLWESIGTHPLSNPIQCFVALFNVSPDIELETEALKRGVRGIFYKDAPREILLKGVKIIMRGRLWFSRDTLAKFVLETRKMTKLTEKKTIPILTSREKEILVMIAAGSTQAEIAEKLCISPHTVRTHTSNIYQKIKVPNRLQAALWAIENLKV